MKWEEIRSKIPDKIVLVEAINAYSKDNKRIIEEMAVINEFEDSKEKGKEAWDTYKRLHRQFPSKELYIFHTSNNTIEVEEGFIGIRGRV